MIFVYTLLVSTALFFLGSRALITKWLWLRYPKGFAAFMDCPMCSGTWYAGGIALGGVLLGYHYPGLDDYHAPIIVALSATAAVPILVGIVQTALFWTGTKDTAGPEQDT